MHLSDSYHPRPSTRIVQRQTVGIASSYQQLSQLARKSLAIRSAIIQANTHPRPPSAYFAGRHLPMRYREMNYRGHCLCGSCTIVIKASTHLKQFSCNCTDCQHTSGSLHSTNIFPLASDVELVGDVHVYEPRPSSGNVVARLFCGTCGSPLAHRSKAFGHHIAIQTGNLPDFRPMPHGLPSPSTTRPTALTPSPPPRHYMLAASPLSLSEGAEQDQKGRAVDVPETAEDSASAWLAASPDTMEDFLDEAEEVGRRAGCRKRKTTTEEEGMAFSGGQSPTPSKRSVRSSSSGSTEVRRSRRLTAART